MNLIRKKIQLLQQISKNQNIQISHLYSKNISLLGDLDQKNEEILNQLIYLDSNFLQESKHKKIKRLLIECQKKNEVITKFYEKLAKKYQLELNFLEYKQQIGRLNWTL